ncbi:S-glutathionyl-(chloro)hydroquinone reductase [Nowakowskiella sp. JEL0407]|nr:S-glutathionyl-(chloro)hydroquinone reductase [Nowakowskiella sp. JEL0407]
MTEPTKSDADAPIFKWVTTKDGDFKRQVSSFRDVVSRASDAKFKAEPNRYHVYISYACPWAHRVLLVLTLKGLRDIISLTVVDHLLGPNGWKISPEVEGATDDPVNHATYLSEIYFKADKDYSGRYTVPVFWDKKTGTIVNNESSEIIRFLNTEFDEWSSAPGVTYYPENLRTEIDAINEWIYDGINNGVYKCGFATLQEPYEKAYVTLFAALDRVEDILKNVRLNITNEMSTDGVIFLSEYVPCPKYVHRS